MRIKAPRQASLDEVRITREGETAIIENADLAVSIVSLAVGPALSSVNDAAVLDLYNGVLEAQDKIAREYDAALVEIPPGRPQIRYSEDSDQWVPRGDVLRCHIDDDEAVELPVHVWTTKC